MATDVPLSNQPARLSPDGTGLLPVEASGLKKVSKALHLDEVHFTIEKGAPGEFPGLCGPYARMAAQGCHDGADDGSAPMQMKLGTILTSERTGRREPSHKGLVKQLSRRRVTNRPQGKITRVRKRAT